MISLQMFLCGQKAAFCFDLFGLSEGMTEDAADYFDLMDEGEEPGFFSASRFINNHFLRGDEFSNDRAPIRPGRWNSSAGKSGVFKRLKDEEMLFSTAKQHLHQ